MFIQSIRFKIILWYMLILALTLSVFSIALYRNVSQTLFGDKDDLLQSRAGGIVDSIDTYWEAERLDAIAAGIKSEAVFSKINNINFAKIAQRWVEEKSDDPDLLNIVVQIFDVNGALIATSKNIPNISIFSKEALKSELQKKIRFDTVTVEFTKNVPTALRVLTMPVVENNRVSYIVQVASPLSSIEVALQNLKITLFVLLPLTVFLTGIIGVFLAKIALNPVDKMIDTIHQITAENLKLKVNIPDTKDEIKRLADTFNEMLGRLEHAFSSQRQFIEDFAHELKTPLAVLKGEMEVVLKKMRSVEEYQLVLLSNLEEVNRINKIVEDLLMLARFDSSVVVLDMKRLDVAPMLKSIVDDMKVLAAQKNIGMDFITQDTITIYGDNNQLKRLFVNLLDNAIKYTPGKGGIIVSATPSGDYAKIIISDTGIGIPESEIEHIFDRFYRLDKARYTPGFGLGLSIAKSIVEAHKGRIEVESKLHQGTTFIIYLPMIHA
ncbi:MAG: heavy metal sensor histidine kinase [Nitrospirae bacterium]|nr:heavy metal sensor histidine kinase [Nitrospirota bacterium]